jgi:hypothetical protein
MKDYEIQLSFENRPMKNSESHFPIECHPVKNCPGNPVHYEKKSMKITQGSFFSFLSPIHAKPFNDKKTAKQNNQIKKVFEFSTPFWFSFFLMIKTPYPLFFSKFAAGRDQVSIKKTI